MVGIAWLVSSWCIWTKARIWSTGRCLASVLKSFTRSFTKGTIVSRVVANILDLDCKRLNSYCNTPKLLVAALVKKVGPKPQ